MDFLQSGVGDVGVNLRRGNRRMSEKFLDSPDIRTVGKQRRSERMPERGRNVFHDARLEGSFGNRGRNEVAGQPYVVGFQRFFSTVQTLEPSVFSSSRLTDFQSSSFGFFLGSDP